MGPGLFHRHTEGLLGGSLAMELRFCCFVFAIGAFVGYMVAKWEQDQLWWWRASQLLQSFSYFKFGSLPAALDSSPAAMPMLCLPVLAGLLKAVGT